jgi:hypothetical protein
MKVNLDEMLARRHYAPEHLSLGGLGFIGKGAAAKKPHAGEGAARPKTPEPAPHVAADDVAIWRTYLGLLHGLIAALRGGKVPADAPEPVAPTVTGTKAQVSEAKNLLEKVLPEARKRRAYTGLPAPAGGGGGGSSGSGSAGGSGGGNGSAGGSGGGSGGGNGSGGGGYTAPDTSVFSGQQAPPLTFAPAVTAGGGSGGAPAAGGGSAAADSGTVIDPATGQPAAASLLSNKWVWIGAGAVAVGWWLFRRRKRGGR